METVKRRKNKYNPYTLEVNHIVTFIDSTGKKQSVILNDELYNEFNLFELQDLKEMNEYDRHIEHLELTEESLYHNTKNKYTSLEDIALKKIIYERLHQEINKLSKIQKRRLKMYYFKDMTLKEIALKENCSIHSVYVSIEQAKEKLKNLLKQM